MQKKIVFVLYTFLPMKKDKNEHTWKTCPCSVHSKLMMLLHQDLILTDQYLNNNIFTMSLVLWALLAYIFLI